MAIDNLDKFDATLSAMRTQPSLWDKKLGENGGLVSKSGMEYVKAWFAHHFSVFGPDSDTLALADLTKQAITQLRANQPSLADKMVQQARLGWDTAAGPDWQSRATSIYQNVHNLKLLSDAERRIEHAEGILEGMQRRFRRENPGALVSTIQQIMSKLKITVPNSVRDLNVGKALQQRIDAANNLALDLLVKAQTYKSASELRRAAMDASRPDHQQMSLQQLEIRQQILTQLEALGTQKLRERIRGTEFEQIPEIAQAEARIHVGKTWVQFEILETQAEAALTQDEDTEEAIDAKRHLLQSLLETSIAVRDELTQSMLQGGPEEQEELAQRMETVQQNLSSKAAQLWLSATQEARASANDIAIDLPADERSARLQTLGRVPLRDLQREADTIPEGLLRNTMQAQLRELRQAITQAKQRLDFIGQLETMTTELNGVRSLDALNGAMQRGYQLAAKLEPELQAVLQQRLKTAPKEFAGKLAEAYEKRWGQISDESSSTDVANAIQQVSKEIRNLRASRQLLGDGPSAKLTDILNGLTGHLIESIGREMQEIDANRHSREPSRNLKEAESRREALDQDVDTLNKLLDRLNLVDEDMSSELREQYEPIRDRLDTQRKLRVLEERLFEIQASQGVTSKTDVRRLASKIKELQRFWERNKESFSKLGKIDDFEKRLRDLAKPGLTQAESDAMLALLPLMLAMLRT